MSKVTVAVAGDMAEADEIRRHLLQAGIEASLEGAESGWGPAEGDGPCRVLVDAAFADPAADALSALDDEGDDERP